MNYISKLINTRKLVLLQIILLATLFLIPTFQVMAQVSGGLNDVAKHKDVNFTDATVETSVGAVIVRVLQFVGAIMLALLVYAGIMWMTAGTSDRVQKAKDLIKAVIIGAVIIFGSYMIIGQIIKYLAEGTVK